MGLQELGFNLVREEGFMPWKKRKIGRAHV